MTLCHRSVLRESGLDWGPMNSRRTAASSPAIAREIARAPQSRLPDNEQRSISCNFAAALVVSLCVCPPLALRFLVMVGVCGDQRREC